MTIRCKAIYEKGALRPDQPLEIPEGAQVNIAVDLVDAISSPDKVAQALSELAAMPMETDDDEFSGSDHDQVLYGKK